MANNTTINSELLVNLLADAQFAAYENSIAKQVVTAFDFPAGTGSTLQVPIYSAVTAAGLTEATAPSAADTNTTSATISLGEIGTYHQISDFLRDSASQDVIGDLGTQSGRAIAEKMDTDVFALFNSVSAGVGTQDTALTVDLMFEAIQTLRNAKVTGPLTAIVSPRQALQLKKALYNAGGTVATSSALGSAVLERGFIGSIGGAQIFESSLVKRDLDSDSDSELNAVGCVFAKSAFGHVQRGPLAINTQYQAASRATDLMVSAVTGQAILQNSHAVKIISSDSD
jgi:N4-gp56 family major capsid protein